MRGFVLEAVAPVRRQEDGRLPARREIREPPDLLVSRDGLALVVRRDVAGMSLGVSSVDVAIVIRDLLGGGDDDIAGVQVQAFGIRGAPNEQK